MNEIVLPGEYYFIFFLTDYSEYIRCNSGTFPTNIAGVSRPIVELLCYLLVLFIQGVPIIDRGLESPMGSLYIFICFVNSLFTKARRLN